MCEGKKKRNSWELDNKAKPTSRFTEPQWNYKCLVSSPPPTPAWRAPPGYSRMLPQSFCWTPALGQTSCTGVSQGGHSGLSTLSIRHYFLHFQRNKMRCKKFYTSLEVMILIHEGTSVWTWEIWLPNGCYLDHIWYIKRKKICPGYNLFRKYHHICHLWGWGEVRGGGKEMFWVSIKLISLKVNCSRSASSQSFSNPTDAGAPYTPVQGAERARRTAPWGLHGRQTCIKYFLHW